MRLATRKDLPRIVEIYNSTIASRVATADTAPVQVDSKLEWFEAHDPDRRPLLIKEHESNVIGWLSFEDFYGRPAYAYTAEISIYFDPVFRGKGLGKEMLQYAIELAPSLDIHNLLGFVFQHNEASVGLLAKFGFEQWGLLPDVALMDGKAYSLCIYGLSLAEGRNRA